MTPAGTPPLSDALSPVLSDALFDSLTRLWPPAAADPADTDNATTTATTTATTGLRRELIQALSAALARGELALDLDGPPPEGVAASAWPTGHLAALAAAGWLSEAGEGAADSDPAAPVVRDGRWLRWLRWHRQLRHCQDSLIAWGRSGIEPAAEAPQLAAATAQAAAAGLDPQQVRAVQALLQHRLVLLSGGPGTGKTSTVVAMLAAALRHRPDLRLQLAAPTGKAAARLSAAVHAGSSGLEPELTARLRNLAGSTLHRLLEARGSGEGSGEGGGFRRGRRRPLELDLLVVDEVSMVDLPLMSALLEALPEGARLLLVGDPGQLPPVGPGAVLLELCTAEARAGLGAAAVELRTTYRNDGAISALAAQLRAGPAPGQTLLDSLRPQLQQLDDTANLQWRQVPAGSPPAEAVRQLQEHQQRLQELARGLDLQEQEPLDGSAPVAALLEELDRLILLSPVRRGPWGVEAVHRRLLGEAAAAPLQRWPVGTPVLNRRNLPEQGLANGDIGVRVERRNGNGVEALVLFPGGRLLHPGCLAGAEPALALTVHKAQGSQYADVLLLLPSRRHDDHRLLYTGLTRARRRAWLFTPAAGSEDPS